MKIIIILAASLLIASCETLNPGMPDPPDGITDYYVIDMASTPVAMHEEFTDMVVNAQDLPIIYPLEVHFACLHFGIISMHPFKIKFTGAVDPNNCAGVGGLRPDDSVKFFNFVDDVIEWGKEKERQRCTP